MELVPVEEYYWTKPAEFEHAEVKRLANASIMRRCVRIRTHCRRYHTVADSVTGCELWVDSQTDALLLSPPPEAQWDSIISRAAPLGERFGATAEWELWEDDEGNRFFRKTSPAESPLRRRRPPPKSNFATAPPPPECRWDRPVGAIAPVDVSGGSFPRCTVEVAGSMPVEQPWYVCTQCDADWSGRGTAAADRGGSGSSGGSNGGATALVVTSQQGKSGSSSGGTGTGSPTNIDGVNGNTSTTAIVLPSAATGGSSSSGGGGGGGGAAAEILKLCVACARRCHAERCGHTVRLGGRGGGRARCMCARLGVCMFEGAAAVAAAARAARDGAAAAETRVLRDLRRRRASSRLTIAYVPDRSPSGDLREVRGWHVCSRPRATTAVDGWIECYDPAPPAQLLPGDIVHPRGKHYRLDPPLPKQKRRGRIPPRNPPSSSLIRGTVPLKAIKEGGEGGTQPLFWSIGTVIRKVAEGWWLVAVTSEMTFTSEGTAVSAGNHYGDAAPPAPPPPAAVERVLSTEQLSAAAPHTFFFNDRLQSAQWHAPPCVRARLVRAATRNLKLKLKLQRIAASLGSLREAPSRKGDSQSSAASAGTTGAAGGTGGSDSGSVVNPIRSAASAGFAGNGRSESVSDDSDSDSSSSSSSAQQGGMGSGGSDSYPELSTDAEGEGDRQVCCCGPPPLLASEWAALRRHAIAHRIMGPITEYRDPATGALLYHDLRAEAREAAALRLQAFYRCRYRRPYLPASRCYESVAFSWEMPAAAAERAQGLCAWAYLRRRAAWVRAIRDADGDTWAEYQDRGTGLHFYACPALWKYQWDAPTLPSGQKPSETGGGARALAVGDDVLYTPALMSSLLPEPKCILRQRVRLRIGHDF